MSAPPTVVVVGSPNAGKSTLVNRLSGSRQAVVHETPGVTRDRKDVEVEWEGRLMRMVDTGGYDTGEESPFAGHIREQVELAIDAADVVLFVVDGRAGPLADDFEIAEVLRRRRVPVVLVANKLDDPAAVSAAQELYQLGLGEPLIVSATHGLGTGELLDRLVEEAGAERPGDAGPATRRPRSRWPSSAVPTPASRRCSTPSSASRAPSSARSPAPRATPSTRP